MKNIMFIAPPAAGKGTQATLVVEKYHIPHISTGDILREISMSDSEVGLYVRETLSSGKLVKDDITYELIKERLARDDCKEGFIIDGFPRNLSQAIRFDEILSELGYTIEIVFYIDTSKETLEKRITSRRICEDCKSVYNLNEVDLTEGEVVCSKCGGRLYQRNDDNLESFKTRYAMYLEQTEPLVDYYNNKNILYKVDGNDSVLNIFKTVDNIISER